MSKKVGRTMTFPQTSRQLTIHPPTLKQEKEESLIDGIKSVPQNGAK